MSGLAGHMMHPHDDFELTGAALKTMIGRSLKGSFIFTEKIDGWGAYFLKVGGTFRVARSRRDLEAGGIKEEDLASRFEHNPEAAKLYGWAIRNLEMYDRNSTYIFQDFEATGAFYVCDVTDVALNIIKYPQCVWLHECKSVSGQRFPLPNVDGYNIKISPVLSLTNNICYNAAAGYECVVGRILEDDETIGEHYQGRLIQWMDNKQIALDPVLVRALWDSYMLNKGRKKVLSQYGQPDNFLNLKQEAVQFIREPLDNLILQVGTLIEMGLGFPGPTNEVLLMMVEDNYGTPQYDRWRDNCFNRIPQREGVVFQYNGKTYKWTGAFAPINQMKGRM